MYIGNINYEKGDTVIHDGNPKESKRKGWIGVVVRIKETSIVVDWLYDKQGREMHGYQGKRITQEYGTNWVMHCMVKSDFSPAEIATHRALNQRTANIIAAHPPLNNLEEQTMEHKRFYLIIHADFEKFPKLYSPTISHGTYGDAQKEALRLSNANNCRFYVMQSLGFAEPPKQPSAMFISI